MSQTIKNKNLSLSTSQKPFGGFHPPTSNTTYTPNQYFDVCMPNYSRGVVRLVGYMLRKTLGWCDVNGKPQETIIPISYESIIKEANISRRALKQAIEEAVKGDFVSFVRVPKPKRRGKNFVTGLLELKWDEEGKYTTDPKEFKGFFAKDGNRTYIPNEFFDVTVKLELLRVSKVVGTIIRNSIGFADKYGHRRKQIQLSISEIAYYSKLCNEKVDKAIKEAVEKSYICIVEKGFIDFSNSSNSKKSIYCLNWCDNTVYKNNGAKRQTSNEIDRGKKANEEINITVQKGKRDNKNIEAKKQTKCEQKGKRNIGKKANDLYKEIKQKNKTLKQQPVAVVKAYEELIKMGFKENPSLEIIKYQPSDKILEIITNQINWLTNRNVKVNKLGLLKKAIKENWSEPENIMNEDMNSKGATFAKYFYAGYAGNNEEPVTEPTDKEIIGAEKYINKLLNICPDEKYAKIWGKQFGQMFKSKFNNTNNNVYVSLLPALRSFGDKFYIQEKSKIQSRNKAKESLKRETHQEKFKGEYLEYLRLTEDTFKEDKREAYLEFLDVRKKQREEVENTPFSSSVWLEDFNKEETRIEAFQKHFLGEILDFWKWDEIFNQEKLDLSVLNIREKSSV